MPWFWMGVLEQDYAVFVGPGMFVPFKRPNTAVGRSDDARGTDAVQREGLKRITFRSGPSISRRALTVDWHAKMNGDVLCREAAMSRVRCGRGSGPWLVCGLFQAPSSRRLESPTSKIIDLVLCVVWCCRVLFTPRGTSGSDESVTPSYAEC